MSPSHLSSIEKAARKLNLLDVAGYGIVYMRCDSEIDIRRTVALYSRARNIKKVTKPNYKGCGKYDVIPYPENIEEVNGFGMVTTMGISFDWQTGGKPKESERYNKDNSFISKISIYSISLEPHLLYIAEPAEFLGHEKKAPYRNDVQSMYLSLLKNAAIKKAAGENGLLIIIPCIDGCLIPELKDYSYVLDVDYPDIDEIEAMLTERCKFYGETHINQAVISDVAEGMRGFRQSEVYHTIDLAYAENQFPFQNRAEALIRNVQSTKAQRISGVKGLSWIAVSSEAAKSVGGLMGLKTWMGRHMDMFRYPHAAKSRGASVPKGVLLCGLPGSGKTTLARYAAAALSGTDTPLPLLQLNLSAMLGKLVGESEGNFHMALKAIESVAPCVLLVDEVEKSFGSVGRGSDHETTTHIFQAMLDWMQRERDKPIFVIATANNINNLPPEFKRKGRFDEVFFVGIPTAAECKAIFKVHMEKKLSLNIIDVHKKDYNSFIDEAFNELIKWATAEQRFLCGSDIETLVHGAFARLFSEIKDKEKFISLNQFQRYCKTQVIEALLQELRETRTYFDNNMRMTAEFWVAMYTQAFRDAGGTDNINVILPSSPSYFDEPTQSGTNADKFQNLIEIRKTESNVPFYNRETYRFSLKQVTSLGGLCGSCSETPPDEPDINAASEEIRQNKRDYVDYVESQKKKAFNIAEPLEMYNCVFRWTLISEIFKLKN